MHRVFVAGVKEAWLLCFHDGTWVCGVLCGALPLLLWSFTIAATNVKCVCVQELVSRNQLSATSKFWRVAFEGVLLRVVDAEQSRKDARVRGPRRPGGRGGGGNG